MILFYEGERGGRWDREVSGRRERNEELEKEVC